MAPSKDSGSCAGRLMGDSESDDNDHVSVANLMRKRKKSYGATLEAQLHQAAKHDLQTVDGALNAIASALGTLKTHFGDSTKSSVRKSLAKLDEGLQGIQAAAAKSKKTEAAPGDSAAAADDASFRVKIKRPKHNTPEKKKALSSSRPPPMDLTPAVVASDETQVDPSMLPLDPKLLDGVVLQLAKTLDGVADDVAWPALVFSSYATAEAWCLDVSLLQMLLPDLGPDDRIYFYFARVDTPHDQRQLLVRSVDDAAASPWSLSARLACDDAAYQFAMQQAARFDAALCPLQAMEWLVECAQGATATEWWQPEQFHAAAAAIADDLAAPPRLPEYTLFLYALWPTMQEHGWRMVRGGTGDVGYSFQDVAYYSRKAAVQAAVTAADTADAVCAILWKYMLKMKKGHGAHGAFEVGRGDRRRTFASVASAVQAYVGPHAADMGASSSVAAADVTFDQVYHVLVTQDGWTQASDSVGYLYCAPTYKTAAAPELGRDFFRSLTDVELYVTLQNRSIWDAAATRVDTTPAPLPSPAVPKLAKVKASSTTSMRSPPPKAKKSKTKSSTGDASSSSSTFVVTFAKVFAYLETKGWFKQPSKLGWTYYKPKADVATAVEGETMFYSDSDVERYLKGNGTWYKVKAVLEGHHRSSSSAATTDATPTTDAVKTELTATAARKKTSARGAAAPKSKTGARTSARTAISSRSPAAVPVFQPTFSKVYSELQKEGWFHRSGQFGWSYYKPGTVVKQAVLDEDMYSNEVHLEQYLKTSGEWQRVVDQKNKEFQELYGPYTPLPESGAVPPPPPASAS
ncbi:Aste57867_5 [Aphanomyces stellatus]|uniref:Aste57867_5 protein n=1 Tax=Aphanomyces stellatus TaxID=120398 RepID=A0A485K1G8_9STRA|nr:hypothetical protein As57867_000005 [Aphanomyces stellatus]VFT77231.1 Aste57867_5 [Aphanomyces stellatus]